MTPADHRWTKTQREREEDKRDDTKIVQVPSGACLRAGMTERGLAKTCPAIDQSASAEHDLLTRPVRGGKSLQDLWSPAKK